MINIFAHVLKSAHFLDNAYVTIYIVIFICIRTFEKLLLIRYSIKSVTSCTEIKNRLYNIGKKY